MMQTIRYKNYIKGRFISCRLLLIACCLLLVACCLLLVAYCLLLPLSLNAAILYLSPESGNYNQNDVFLVEIRLNTEGEYINALEIELDFPSDILEVNDFSKGNSILTLWVEEPELAKLSFDDEKLSSANSGQFSFSGGTPGGYQGIDGLIGRIIFQVKVQNWQSLALPVLAEIKFPENSKVLLNDGKGTPTTLITRGAIFDIAAGTGEERNLWQEEKAKDKILPEPFKIGLGKDPNIFDGKYFIVFSTVDKQTGIDHYEVKEGSDKWKDAVSPYVLKNQELTDDIWAKAIDKAGNFWMETLEAQNPKKIRWETYIILGLILIVVMIILWIIRRKRWIYDKAREKYK